MWYDAFVFVQCTLGIVMCVLVTAKLVRQSLQMYRATQKVQMNKYMSLLIKDGFVYFLAYVTLSPSFSADMVNSFNVVCSAFS